MVPGQCPGWEERREGLWETWHTIPGVSSGCGIEGMAGDGMWGEGMWVEGMWGEGMFHMVTHRSRCSNTTAPARAPQ